MDVIILRLESEREQELKEQMFPHFTERANRFNINKSLEINHEVQEKENWIRSGENQRECLR